MLNSKKHIVIVGPTASSKSSIAITLAQHFNNQPIISLDSMQIYKGFEIGTGVIPADERENIEHYMLSFQDPTESYNAKKFSVKVNEILNTNENKFILVGGTGLYTHGIIDGFNFAPTDEAIRQNIIEKYELDENEPNHEKVEIAYKKLQEQDQFAAEKIDMLNVRRIIRAFEVMEITGEKFSKTFKENGVQTFGEPKLDCEIVGIRYTRENLKERIEIRIREMFEMGWTEEVKKLLPIWEQIVAPAQNAIGYKQIKEYIENGEDEEEFEHLIELILNKSMQFSRRQRKWFERDPRISWIDCDEITYDETIERIIQKCV